MALRRRVAAFNKVVTNPIQGTWAWLVAPWAVVVHRGRRSGRVYRTPVLAWVRGDRVAIGVLYGEESDWVRNLLAAGKGEMVRFGRTVPLIGPRVVDAAEAQRLAGFAGRIAAVRGKALVAKLGPRADR